MDDPSASSPEAALAEVRRLRRRVHERAHGGAWLPAAAIAGLLLASLILYRYPFETPSAMSGSYPYWAGLPDEERSPAGSYLFWFVGTPIVLALTAAWYARRARHTGMRVAWRPFVVTGLGVLGFLAVLAAVPGGQSIGNWGFMLGVPIIWTGIMTPLFPIAAAVIVLGWAERSRGLIAAGAWVAVLAWWLCGSQPLGRLSPWVASVLGGGGGPGLGGELALRPGHYVIIMALPLLVFAIVRLPWRRSKVDQRTGRSIGAA